MTINDLIGILTGAGFTCTVEKQKHIATPAGWVTAGNSVRNPRDYYVYDINRPGKTNYRNTISIFQDNQFTINSNSSDSKKYDDPNKWWFYTSIDNGGKIYTTEQMRDLLSDVLLEIRKQMSVSEYRNMILDKIV